MNDKIRTQAKRPSNLKEDCDKLKMCSWPLNKLELHRSTNMRIFFNKYLYCAFDLWLGVCAGGGPTLSVDLHHSV